MTPDTYTIAESFLDVGDGHRLYIHEWGKAKAKMPILFLHGGPGSQVKDKHKGIFDPAKQRVIFFDQRGAGKSLPYGSLEHNTTQDLISDIEKIADHFSLKQFVITGGSWGSCLAFAYTLTHPKRVAALVLHGVFSGSKAEIEWLDKGRFQTFFPDVWQRYLDSTPQTHRYNPSRYHFDRILGNNEAAQRESGYIYENLEGSVMALDDRFEPEDPETYDPAGIRIEVHYMQHGCFLPDEYILKNAHKLATPVWLIQGRYDVVCPPITAWRLNQILANSHLIWSINGHKAEHESWNLQRTILAQWSD
ncbi:alpha/beta fold hydrolase [Candidatus Saccharibacteria bacterium]|nr:alpha/beta fold hydrolase [Candidatus Saccharibacteria bacterium]